MKTPMIVLASLLTIAAGVSIVEARPGSKADNRMHNKPMSSLARHQNPIEKILTHQNELKLQQSQITSLESLDNNLRRDQRQLTIKLRTVRKDLKELSDNNQLSTESIADFSSNIGDIKGEMLRLRLDARLQLSQILNSEQKESIKQKRQQLKRPNPPRA